MAQWMIGETYFLQKNYRDAIISYHRVTRYPRWQAASLLQAAKCRVLLKEPKEALQLLDQLIQDFPQSEYVEQARTMQSELAAASPIP